MHRRGFSLLHATWKRAGGPIEIREAWLSTAVFPDQIEYLPAMDSDDDLALAQTQYLTRAIGEPLDYSSAVRNWNSAAQLATKDFLFVISDDLFPEAGWDVKLLDLLARFEPRKQAFVVKIADSRNQRLKRVMHPLVSASFYNQFGLFDDRYSHYYCDTDFSLRASRVVPILDGRSVKFHHHHKVEGYKDDSESHLRGRAELASARVVFRSHWSMVRRLRGSGLVPKSLFSFVALAPKAGPIIQFFTSLPEWPLNLRREILWANKSSAARRLRRRWRRIKRILSF